MARPQCEDGYTKIANELLDAMCQARLQQNQWIVLLAIVRKTYGWNKKKDWISGGQIAEMTNLPRQRVYEALRALESRHIILRDGRLTGIQKDYTLWLDVTGKRYNGKSEKTRLNVTDDTDKRVMNDTDKRDYKRQERQYTKESTLSNPKPKRDYLDDVVAGQDKGESWTVPSGAGGADSMGDALLAIFARYVQITPETIPKRQKRQWRKALSDVALEWQCDQQQATAALEALLDPDGEFNWKTYSNPMQKTFQADWGMYLGRALTSDTGDIILTPEELRQVEQIKRETELSRIRFGRCE